MELKMKKKGQVNVLTSNAIALVVAGITLAIGLTIMSGIGDDITDGNASSAVNDAVSGIGKLSSFLPTIGLVIAAIVVLGYVFLLRR